MYDDVKYIYWQYGIGKSIIHYIMVTTTEQIYTTLYSIPHGMFLDANHCMHAKILSRSNIPHVNEITFLLCDV